MKTLRLLVGGILLFSGIARSGEPEERPLQVVLKAEKAVYRQDEPIVFHLTIVNVSPRPVKVLVRGFNWEDLAKMDLRYQENLERAKIDPQWGRFAKDGNLADKIRAENPPSPLGTLEWIGQGKATAGYRVDVDSLFCGTGLLNGMMPPGMKIEREFTVKGAYVGSGSFVWRASPPKKEKGLPKESLDAASNPVKITVTE